MTSNPTPYKCSECSTLFNSTADLAIVFSEALRCSNCLCEDDLFFIKVQHSIGGNAGPTLLIYTEDRGVCFTVPSSAALFDQVVDSMGDLSKAFFWASVFNKQLNILLNLGVQPDPNW